VVSLVWGVNMQLDPLNIERTEWKTKNLMSLFEKALPLFPQLEEEDMNTTTQRFSQLQLAKMSGLTRATVALWSLMKLIPR